MAAARTHWYLRLAGGLSGSSMMKVPASSLCTMVAGAAGARAGAADAAAAAACSGALAPAASDAAAAATAVVLAMATMGATKRYNPVRAAKRAAVVPTPTVAAGAAAADAVVAAAAARLQLVTTTCPHPNVDMATCGAEKGQLRNICACALC